MITRPATFSLFLMFLFVGDDAMAQQSASGVLNDATLARAALNDIRKLNEDLKENRAAQEKAWPTREADQANEMATPPEVEQLQVTQVKLERKRDRRLRDLQRFSENDLGPVLDALSRTRDRAFLDAVIPVAVKAGKDDGRLLKILKRFEERFDVCPPSVVNGLADLEKEEASLSLLELGLKEKSLSVLRAAGKSGDPIVLAQLITAAESNDKALAAVCRRTLLRLTPPPRPSPKLVGLVTHRITEVRSPELKTTLIVYLGLCKNEVSLVPLQKAYDQNKDERIRAAVIGALGNLGTETASSFVLAKLKKKTLPLALEKSCIHSLGAARYRPAVPYLIELLDDPTLNRVTAHALARVSGQDFGQTKGTWLRWWRAQPEAKGFKDRDE